GTCSTTRIATSRSGGRPLTKRVSAGTPPADAPTATIPVGARISRSSALATTTVYPLPCAKEQCQKKRCEGRRMPMPFRGKIGLVNGQQPGRGGPENRSVDIVIVAQDGDEVRGLEVALRNRGSVVARAHDSDSIAKVVVGGRPDAIIVDLRDHDGLSERLLSWICRNAPVPALVVTALSDTR